MLLSIDVERRAFTCGLLLIPRNHALGFWPTGGLTWSAWHVAQDQDEENAVAFKHTLKGHKLTASAIPNGLLAFSASGQIKYGTRSPLNPFWFFPCLLPSVTGAERIVDEYWTQWMTQLGGFFMRPLADAVLTRTGGGQVCSRGSTDTWCLLLTSEGWFEGGSRGSRVRQLQKIEMELRSRVSLLERGRPVTPDELTPSQLQTLVLVLPVQPGTAADAAELEQLRRITVLRARLVRLLCWPMFWARSELQLSDLRSLDWRGSDYDPVHELLAYRQEWLERFPVLGADPMAGFLGRSQRDA